VLPIGDDAAAFRPHPSRLLLISSDTLIEGIHFDLQYFSAEDLGWKALAVNLSDIAAMGGIPLYVTTSIALPGRLPAGFVRDLYSGLSTLALENNVSVIGGDTCASPHSLYVDLTIVGEVEPEEMVTRQGAKPGDLIFLTGELGGSAAGLEILKRQGGAADRHSALARRHLRPQARCNVGRFLATEHLASALIDVSDGLSTDLHHLCMQSRVGALLQAERIPLVSFAAEDLSGLSRQILDYALNGGEDYELLFTVPQSEKQRMPQSIGGVPVHQIGYITDEPGICWLRKGDHKERLSAGGFDHFRR
jgi:thiamine-monophosphate kinase